MSLLSQIERILKDIEFPLEQLPKAWAERTPKVILALGRVERDHVDLTALSGWGDDNISLLSSREIIDFINSQWAENVSRGSYDEVRRKCIKYLVSAGVAVKNPDEPSRAANSPKTGYCLSSEFVELATHYGTEDYKLLLSGYKNKNESLRARLRNSRDMNSVPVTLPNGVELKLSPGAHNKLQKAIIEQFLSRFVPKCDFIYIGDSLDRHLYKDQKLIEEAGLFDLDHGDLPDIIVLDLERNWIVIIEAVASSGHISAFRHDHLRNLLRNCRYGVVYVTAFPDHRIYSKFASDIAWETEVWIADHPTHLIHYDGKRYLGPYV